MNMIQKLCLLLLIVGGLNWGLIGFLQFDLVGFLFGGQAALLSRIIFAVVGISAIVSVTSLFVPDENSSEQV